MFPLKLLDCESACSCSTETFSCWELWSFISFKIFQGQDVSLGRMPLGQSRGTPNSTFKKACHYNCIFTVLTKTNYVSGNLYFPNMINALNIFFVCLRMRKSTRTFPVKAYHFFCHEIPHYQYNTEVQFLIICYRVDFRSKIIFLTRVNAYVLVLKTTVGCCVTDLKGKWWLYHLRLQTGMSSDTFVFVIEKSYLL